MERLTLLVRAAGAAIAAIGGLAVGIGGLNWATLGVLAEVREAPSFDALVGLAAACGAWIALLWLVAGFVVAALAALPSAAGSLDRLSAHIAPVSVRRAARFLVGACIVSCGVAGTALPASADTGSPVAPATTPATGPLPDLDRPVSAGSPASPTAAVPTSPRGPSTGSSPGVPGEPGGPGLPDASTSSGQGRSAVMVVRGDTLWDIAAARLGTNATNPEIAAEWPRWYAKNRELIGSNPDLIFPGQRLLPPDA
jgi:resuscitation-promoting factor RpfA